MREVSIPDLYHGEKKMATEFRADRPMHTGGKKFEECTVDGTRYYLVDDEKWYDADTYDKMFNPPRGVVLKKGEQMPLKGVWPGGGQKNKQIIPRGANEKGVNRYQRNNKKRA